MKFAMMFAICWHLILEREDLTAEIDKKADSSKIDLLVSQVEILSDETVPTALGLFALGIVSIGQRTFQVDAATPGETSYHWTNRTIVLASVIWTYRVAGIHARSAGGHELRQGRADDAYRLHHPAPIYVGMMMVQGMF
ncbi:unnamed protein product [Symbiodinium sp. KB8]|nr:unnamed protein product [Symbiodinium sp. KB8]